MSRSRRRLRYSSSSASYTSSSSESSLSSHDHPATRRAQRAGGKVQKSSTNVISPEQQRQLGTLRKEAKDILLDVSCDLANHYTRKPKAWLEKRFNRQLPSICNRHSRRAAEQAKQERQSSSSSASGSSYGSGGSGTYSSSDSDGRGPLRSPSPSRCPGPHKGQRLLLDRPYRSERTPSPDVPKRPSWQRVPSFDEAVEDAKHGNRRGEIDPTPSSLSDLVIDTPSTGGSADGRNRIAASSAPRLPDLIQVYSRRTRRAKRVSSESCASSSSAPIASSAGLPKSQASIVPSAPITPEPHAVQMPIRPQVRTPSPQPPPTHIASPPAPITKPDESPKTRPPRPQSALSDSSAAQIEDWASTYKAYQRSHLARPPTKTPSPPASVPASEISSMPPTPEIYRFTQPLAIESENEGAERPRPRIERQRKAAEGRPMTSANEPWVRRRSEEGSPYTNLPEVVPGFLVSFPPAVPAAAAAPSPTGAGNSRPTSSSSQLSARVPYAALSGQEDIPEPLRVGPRPTTTAPAPAARPGSGGTGSPVDPPASSSPAGQTRRPAFMFVSGSKRRTYSPGGSEIDRKRDA